MIIYTLTRYWQRSSLIGSFTARISAHYLYAQCCGNKLRGLPSQPSAIDQKFFALLDLKSREQQSKG